MNWHVNNIMILPWFEKNKENEGALHLALRNKRKDLALYILSLLRDEQTVEKLLNYYKPEHSILFLAVQNNCPKVTEAILKRLDKGSRVKYLMNTQSKILINLQDSDGLTPLHKAIEKDDLFLTETLLTIDKIIYDIKDDKDKSAIELLAEKCKGKIGNQAWERMCKRIGLIDPKIRTTYFRTNANLLDVRNSLFVVAALLATITFTAGFTIPGGFNQDSGEAILAKKTAFLAFLVSNTLALFFSMLVLISLVWSMVYDSSKSLVLIDRSMVLLLLALNCTLLAFMTGVYVVIAPKSLWPAILIIVIMSLLIGISINKTLFYTTLEYIYKLFPSSSNNCIHRFRLLESGCVSNKNE